MAAFSMIALVYAVSRVLLKYCFYIHFKKKQKYERKRAPKRGLRSGLFLFFIYKNHLINLVVDLWELVSFGTEDLMKPAKNSFIRERRCAFSKAGKSSPDYNGLESLSLDLPEVCTNQEDSVCFSKSTPTRSREVTGDENSSFD